MTARLTGIAAALLALTGCGYKGAESLPLPGTVDGPDTYSVTVVFDDATKLVPKETCRSNDTVVGSVESITLDDGLNARVVCRIKDSVELPGNAVGQLRQTAILGERYVALDPPRGVEPRGRLEAGAVLPENTTHIDPDTEQVLGALSAVLNGGSLGRIADISAELNAALSGRTSNVRSVLQRLGRMAAEFNANRDSITAALDALDRLSTTVHEQRQVLGSAIDAIPDGLRVLNNQRPKIVATLRAMSELSSVAVPLIERSKRSTVANLGHLERVLSELGKNGREIVDSLEMSLSFPFGSNSPSTFKGDYGGFFLTLKLDMDTINGLLASSVPQSQASDPTNDPLSEGDTDLGLPSLPLDDLDELLDSMPVAPNQAPADSLGDLLTGGAR